MAKKGIARISISLPPDLLRTFDDMIKSMGYDRSKAIQMAMRNFITDYKWTLAKGEATGALAMIYDHTARGIEEKLTEIQHTHERTIASSMHIHLDERNCLEIIAVKGPIQSIQKLAEMLMRERGVKQLKLAIVTP